MLQVRGVKKNFKNGKETVPALRGVSFSAKEGEIVTLLGPSGCGKTTTLRCIAGLENPDVGELEIAGETMFSSSSGTVIRANRRRLSMVFQSYAIWPHMTVRGNVAFPLQASRVNRAEIGARVMSALEMVGLDAAADRPATKLSGGQQQRVALARAIVQDASLLLLDEPLSNLDATLRLQMRAELRDLQRRVGTTTIYVTHDQEEAMALSDRVILFDGGLVVEEGVPEELYLAPKHEFTARFLGDANLWSATWVGAESGQGVVTTSFGEAIRIGTRAVAPGPSFELMIRPEHVLLDRLLESDGQTEGCNVFPGRIIAATFSGRLVDYLVALDSGPSVRAQTLSNDLLQKGEYVAVTLPPQQCVLVDASAETDN